MSIFGTNLAPATTLWKGDFPTSLGGVSVTVNGKPAYLWFVSATQINLQTPDDTATGTVPVVVTNANGTATSTVTIGQFAPSFLLQDAKYATAIVITPGSPGNSSGGYDIIAPTGQFSYTTRPVKQGETLVLYGVGFGPTTPVVPSGQLFASAAPTNAANPVQVTIGGVSAPVAFSGLVGAGLYQLNVTVPSTGSGDKLLLATVGGVQTQANVVVPVQ